MEQHLKTWPKCLWSKILISQWRQWWKTRHSGLKLVPNPRI